MDVESSAKYPILYPPLSVPHHLHPAAAHAHAAAAAAAAAANGGKMGNGYTFRSSRPFERNPTTWVPQAPMRNGKKKTRCTLCFPSKKELI